MTCRVEPIPEGFHSIIPHLVARGASEAIAYYQQAFGAQELCRIPAPDGEHIMHAALQIGGSKIFLADEHPEMDCLGPQSIGGSAVTLHMYVEDVDQAFDRAITAGGQALLPPQDMFWGDRYGVLKDPFGHLWSLATHKEELSAEEMAKRMEAACAPEA